MRAAGPEDRAEWRFVLAGTACLAVVLAYGVGHHELWRDEAQAWLLSNDAPSFWSLVTGAGRRYEGHPCVWFVLLRLLGRVSRDHVVLSLTAYCVALANGSLLLALWPIPRWQRVLVACSYFPLFEYGVFARNYGLALFWLLLAMHAALAPRPRHWLVGVLAGLTINTVIAAGIPAAVLLAAVYARPLLTTLRRTGVRGLLGAGALAPVVFVASALLAIATTPLPKDAVAQLGPMPPPTLGTLHEIGRRLFEAFVPIPRLSPYDGWWWNSNQFLPNFEQVGFDTHADRVQSALFAMVGGALAVGWVGALWAEPAAALALAAGLLAALGLFLRVATHAVRYEGHLVLCLLPAIAVAAARQPRIARGRLTAVCFATTFGAGTVASAVALYRDGHEPFSNSKNAAARLEQLGPTARPVVGFEYYRMASLAAYLGHELYSPEHDRIISYGLWSRRFHSRHYFSASLAVVHRGMCRAFSLARAGSPAVLVASGRLRFPPELEPYVHLDRSLKGSQTEDFWIYLVTRAPAASLAPVCDDRITAKPPWLLP